MKRNKLMKKFVFALASAAFAAGLGMGAAVAEEQTVTPHFPLKEPVEQSWTFGGFFGKYDKEQLQRGLKVYKEVCSTCHSMNLVAFRNLQDLGYNEAQVKAFAAGYDVQDGPNADGEMFTRKGLPADHFPSPFANDAAAAAANGGATPPDFSLLAKARGVERGFPQFVFDMFWPYQEGGPDYIHSLITGFQDAPAGVTVPEGTYYNPYFANGISLKMPPPISDGQVTYDDGAPQTVDQYAKDVAAFMMWAAEPKLEERKRTGFMVMIFLLGLASLVYLTKKAVFADQH
jgi:ubiquinol-cytochrome c reductase cytochrome c1 subunit